MNKQITLFTGYLGAPIREHSVNFAKASNFSLLDLDEEIVKRDGRSIIRICMMMGEHEYRNKEYDILNEIKENPNKFIGDKEGLVVMCGDGVLYDEMSKALADNFDIRICGDDMSEEELWQNAKTIQNSYHAFLNFGSEEDKRAKFHDFYQRQKAFYDSLGGK